MERPTQRVADVRVIETKGPWESKSGGHLNVRLAIPHEEFMAITSYDNAAIDAIKAESGFDIRGFRVYTVSDIPLGAEGANEWHRVRTEIVTVNRGSILWTCIDSSGEEREFEIDENVAVITPPGILHRYRSLAEGTQIQVMCNTLFFPDSPSTHDTFGPEPFTNYAKL